MSERPAPPRIALTRKEAAASLGMGLTSFKVHVQPHVRIIRRGKLRVIPVRELERWAAENAERALADQVGAQEARPATGALGSGRRDA